MRFLTIFLTVVFFLGCGPLEARSSRPLHSMTFQLVKTSLWTEGVSVDPLRQRLGERPAEERNVEDYFPEIPEIPVVMVQQPEELTLPIQRFLGI